MSELKAEHDSTPLTQDTIAEEDDNLSDMGSHTGSERDAMSEAGSETPSMSDKSSLRNNHSASNTPTTTRSTRSRDNPEFAAKQKVFMAKVQAATAGVESVMVRPETPGKRKRDSSAQGSAKKRKSGKVDNNGQDYQNDNYCWECHREGVFICCEMCPRVFHLKCAGMEKEPEEDWACSECHAVMQAENIENRSRSMQLISVEQLCTLLKFALNRLKTMPGMEPFTKPVDTAEFPTYEDIVVHPVDFMSLERNIKRKFYGSTEAFSSDARWIVHNSVIFNGANSKVSSMARTLVKILKQEMSEIETCPDCYMNAHQNPNSWFTEACRSAHPLIWARLKGFPFWPAKAVKWRDGNVDVRFFGRHDRSWVPMKECFLFSEQMPTPLKNRNKTLESCLQEVNEHIVKLRERFGRFKYAPHRVQFNPADPDQIKIMLPNYKGPMALRVRSQSRALSRLSGHSDDETSSIGSTDSGASVRRRKRESGTSSATQGTETEVEIPNSDPAHGDHHNMTRLGDEERSTLSQEHIKREVKDERQKDLEEDEEEEEDSKINVKFSSKTGDDDSDEEMENCDKYPGGNYEDDENFDEEDDSSIVNGKTLHPRTINNQSEDDEEDEEEDEENYTDEYPSNRKRFLVGNLKDESIDEMESKDASEDEGCEKDDEREEKIDNSEEQEEEIGNLALNTGEEVQDEDGTLKSDEETLCDIKNDHKESVSEVQGLDKEIKAPENVASKVWPRNEDILNSPDVKPFENDSETPRSRERQMNDDSDSEMAESEKHDGGRINANRDQKLKDDDDDDDGGESENEGITENAQLFESDNIRTAVKEEDDTSNGGGKTEFNNVTSDVLENLEKECKKELSESEDSENEDETKNKRTFLEKMESDSESDKSESESENKFREKKIRLDESDDSDKSGDEDDKETSMDYRNRTESEDEESDTEKRHFGKEVRETYENDSENSRSSTGSDSKMVGDSVPDVDEDEDDTKIVKKSRSSDEQMDVDSKSEEPNNRTRHIVKDRVKEEIVSSEEIERKMEKDSEDSNQEDKDSSKNSLFDAVQLMKTMGTIAITRLDGKSLERGNSNNGVTISLAKEQPKSEVDDRRSENEQANRTSPSSRVASPVQKLSESRDMEQHISSLGCSVSVTKAVEKDKDKEKEKEKVKMPSGVDTTRLSPSISIIPMSGGSDRQRTKTTIAPSASPSPSRTSPSVSAQHAPRSSPSVLVQNPPQSSPSTTQGVPPRVSSSSSSSSPQTSGSGIPPPPPLSHPQASAAGGVGSRGVFGPPPPGSQVLGMGGARGPIMATPGMRMMGGGGPGMMVPSRMPGGPPTRHLPPEAGPLSAQLHKHSQKLAEVMRATLEDVLGGLVMTGTPEARVAALQLELERTNWRHQQELAEVRHNADVMLVEMRANLEAEKQRAVEEVKRQMEQQMMEGRRQMERQMVERLAEVRRQLEAEKQRAVEETKKKQWCANCGKEALFFCCWNTSYCDYPCQQSHWPQHMSVCGQNSDGGGGGDGGPDSVNGEASGHSSRVSTPVQNLVAAQFVDDEGVAAMAEEHRRRKHREDDVGSLTSSILAQCLIKGNRDRPRKKPRSSTKSSGSSKEKDSASNASPKAPKSPKAWMDWFLEQSGAEGIKENLQVTPKTTKTKTRKSGKVTDGSRKKRKSTPCVRRKIEHILKPEEVTEEMLNRVATKPKEKTHDQENGTSCHQCRQKTSDTKTICRSGKCVGLRGFFCGPCLRTRYGEDARKALLDPDWCCPVCRGICNCSLCRKAFGQQAVGQIVQRLGKMGYSSVQQYLDSKSSKEEKPEIPIKPVEDKQSQLDHDGDEESQDVEDMKEEKPELVGENDEESLLDT